MDVKFAHFMRKSCAIYRFNVKNGASSCTHLEKIRRYSRVGVMLSVGPGILVIISQMSSSGALLPRTYPSLKNEGVIITVDSVLLTQFEVKTSVRPLDGNSGPKN